MDTLNPDCIREIIEHLDLRDQISLFQVNCLLREAVLSFWRVKYKHSEINFLEKSLKNEEYEIFLEAIKDFAQVLALRFMDAQKYEVVKKFVYPYVKNLRLTIHPCFIKDEDLKDLHRIFPNLTAFSPHGDLTGQYLDLWQHLKELNLSYCYKLELVHFHHIMKALHLEHVELNKFPISQQCEQLDLQQAQVEHLKYLRLNTYELYYFLAQPLPNLKKLIITNQFNPRQLFDVLLSVWKVDEIHKLETANVENVLANCLEMNMNVEELCIINDLNALPQNVIKSLHMLDNLRKLRLKNCKLYTVDLKELLQSIPQVDEISLEDCRLQDEHILLNVIQIVGDREKTLRLNFWQNLSRSLRDVANCEWKNPPYITVSLRGHHHLFEFTQLQGCDLSFEPLYIQFR